MKSMSVKLKNALEGVYEELKDSIFKEDSAKAHACLDAMHSIIAIEMPDIRKRNNVVSYRSYNKGE